MQACNVGANDFQKRDGEKEREKELRVHHILNNFYYCNKILTSVGDTWQQLCCSVLSAGAGR